MSELETPKNTKERIKQTKVVDRWGEPVPIADTWWGDPGYRSHLGVGEYLYSPNTATSHARFDFLLVVEQRQRARELVIGSLRQDIWPLYEQKRGEGSYPRRDSDLGEGLRIWADKCNLCRNGKGLWVIEEALDTLEWWWGCPKRDELLVFATYDYWDLNSEQENWLNRKFRSVSARPDWRGCKTLVGWNPYVETEKQFRARVQRYINYTKRMAEERGSLPVSEKLLQHIEWLVRYQVERELLDDIATSSNVTIEAVKRAIHDLRKLIDLPTFRRGRSPQ